MEIIKAGAPTRADLDRIRVDLVNAETALEEVAAATLSIDDAVARFLERHSQSRDRAGQYFTGFARPGTPDPLHESDAVGAMLWLDAAGVEKQLRARLKATVTPGQSIEARAAAIEKLQRQIAALEESEEVAICALEEQGLFVERDIEADVEMMLRVWDGLRPGK